MLTIAPKMQKIRKIIKRAEDIERLAAEVDPHKLLYPSGCTVEKVEKNSVVAEGNVFCLELEGGPYDLDISLNGRFLSMGGAKGHLSVIEWQRKKLRFEKDLDDEIRAVKWLHNENFLAVAQKKFTYIYDHHGVELHRLKKHTDVLFLDFLPYHFLLTSASTGSMLRYHDVSTGSLVSEKCTKSGVITAMSGSLNSGIMHIGHSNGSVTLWSPLSSEPLAKLFCHKGPITALAVDNAGSKMATAALDGQIKLWDIRNFSRELSLYTTSSVSFLNFSQTGQLCSSQGNKISIWNSPTKSNRAPDVTHKLSKCTVYRAKFCPFEDYIISGLDSGVRSFPASGSCIENYDSFEFNPYSTAKQRQEMEVKSLLNKLPPDTISLAGIYKTSSNDSATQEKVSQAPQHVDREYDGAQPELKRFIKK